MKYKGKSFKNGKYVNPYLFFGLAFLVTVVLYALRLSDFNVYLGRNITLFLIITIVINFTFYFITRNDLNFAIKKAMLYQKQNEKLYLVLGFIFLFLGFAEALYSGGIPVLGQVNYKDYGIPTLHVLIVCCNSFFLLILSKGIFLKEENKKKLVISFCLACVPLLLSLSRGTIIIVLLGIVMLYILENNQIFKKKNLIFLAMLALLGMYLFGIIGNYRINHDYSKKEDIRQSSLITLIGKENQRFENTKISPTFFWTYIYITSPIANFHLNTEWHNVNEHSNFIEYSAVTFLPDFISKRMYPSVESEKAPRLITPEFTAASAFSIPYIMYGWTGLIIFILYELFFPIFYLKLVSIFAKQYFDIATVLISIMYVLMPFSNFFSFSALVIQLLLPFCCSLFTLRREI